MLSRLLVRNASMVRIASYAVLLGSKEPCGTTSLSHRFLPLDPERFVGGVIDLAVESRFLAVIRHPNIIKMRAMSDGNPYDQGFFLVLDRLYATLTMKISEWKKQTEKSKGLGKMFDMKGKKKRKVWCDRLVVVYDLSTALEYLHNKK